ncbi:MAG TPA: hypothetical protein VJV77_03385 [Casimicrobiaceae bacterium]|nr:hypothetical protein [Casimicrobiaceae bacterium]
MSSTTIAASVLAFTFVGALSGLALRTRLPSHHLEDDSRDVIRLVLGLIATVAGLVLGLLISSAHRAYDAQEAEVRQIAVHLFQLDRTLEQLGPEAAIPRRLLRQIVMSEVDYATTASGKGVAIDKPLQAQQQSAELFDRIAGLTPKTDTQRFMQAQALRLLGNMGDTRLLLTEQARGSLSWPFLIVLSFWLTMLFVGFGLFARRNATVVTALFMGAVCVAGAVFLILELNRPYGGVIEISIEPIRNALSQMGTARAAKDEAGSLLPAR